MEVRVTTNHNIEGSEALNKYIGSEIKEKLGRFDEYLTKIEVHLADETSQKKTPDDKRCILQANVKGRPSIVATNHGNSIDEALGKSLSTLKDSLDAYVTQLRNH